MSANIGGYIRGPWWRYNEDGEKIRRCFVIAWGNIVKNPVEWYSGSSAIKFVIKCGRGAGRNEKHLLCVGYGDQMSSVVMRAMEKGDAVLVCGTWNENSEKKTKRGITTVYECRVNFIIPQGLLGYLLDLYSTPEARQMVNRHKDAVADPWESDDDDYGF